MLVLLPFTPILIQYARVRNECIGLRIFDAKRCRMKKGNKNILY